MHTLPEPVRQALVDQVWNELRRLSQETEAGVSTENLDRIYSAACGILDLIDQLREPQITEEDDEVPPDLDLDELVDPQPAARTIQ